MAEAKLLTSINDVNALARSIQERRFLMGNVWEYYRGQGRPEYQLIPSIARGLKSGEEVKSREQEYFSKFDSEITNLGVGNLLRNDPNLEKNENAWNIHIQCQHFGLPTRLLDWSLDWRVGLWFAVENHGNDDVDGQFWVFFRPNQIGLSIDDGNRFFDHDIDQLDKTYFINAPIYLSEELYNQPAEIKRMRQHGKFSISPFEKCLVPLDQQEELAGFFEVYVIPADSKPIIREELEKLGLDAEHLYYREHDHGVIDKLVSKIKL